MQRRLDPERRAQRLADDRRRAQRPHRQVAPRRTDARFERDELHQVVQHRHLAAREDVGPVGGGLLRRAQAKTLDEIVDEGEVVVNPSVAERHPPPVRDGAKQFQQTAIAGAVDAARAYDRQLDAVPRRRLAREPFALELRLLVDVARAQRRILVRRRMLDVAVDADRAAVDDARDAVARRRFDERAGGSSVHRAVFFVLQPRLPIDRGNVVDDVHAVGGARKRVAVPDVAGDERHAGRRQRLRRRALRAHQRRDGVAARRQCSRKMAAGEPRRAGD